MNVALTIAGSDPSGGAGIQADLKTFHQFGVYGEAAIALLTVQNTTTVERVECLPAGLVAQQIRAVLGDIPPGAIKTGALGNDEIINAVAEVLAPNDAPVVVDPVMVSKHGARLISGSLTRLIGLATLLTPNLHEASVLTDTEVSDVGGMRRAAERLREMGACAVLVKGGHLAGDAVDVLLYEGKWFDFPAPRIQTRSTHGAGCTYSAAITACLASGNDLPTAVERAKRFVTEAVRSAPALGRGQGPLNHFAQLKADG